jgi:hypothetical protein
MLRLRLQKIGSWLGLLAILMSTLAPTVSQTLAAHDRLGNALASYCSAQQPPSDPGDAGKTAPASGYHWQACGYCGLLAHLPVLPGIVAVFAAALLVVRAPMRAVRATLHVPLCHTAALPRAPPVFS